MRCWRLHAATVRPKPGSDRTKPQRLSSFRSTPWRMASRAKSKRSTSRHRVRSSGWTPGKAGSGPRCRSSAAAGDASARLRHSVGSPSPWRSSTRYSAKAVSSSPSVGTNRTDLICVSLRNRAVAVAVTNDAQRPRGPRPRRHHGCHCP